MTHSVSDMLRFAVILPLIGVTLGVTYAEAYSRWYPSIVRICAPICGMCVVVIIAPELQSGTQLIFATLVITTMYMYFLVGMLFYAALISNLIVLAVYVGTMLVSDMPAREAAYSIMLLALTNVVGAVVCYHLETANRVGYLEARLLGDMAARDGLTRIYNRRMFDERIEELWSQAGREGETLALLLLDIDCFKPFNDCYGHQAGDETLRAVAVAFSHFARRPLDFTARYGGGGVRAGALRRGSCVRYRGCGASACGDRGPRRDARTLNGGTSPHRQHRRSLCAAHREPQPRGADSARGRGALRRQTRRTQPHRDDGDGVRGTANGSVPRVEEGLKSYGRVALALGVILVDGQLVAAIGVARTRNIPSVLKLIAMSPCASIAMTPPSAGRRAACAARLHRPPCAESCPCSPSTHGCRTRPPSG